MVANSIHADKVSLARVFLFLLLMILILPFEWPQGLEPLGHELEAEWLVETAPDPRSEV